MNYKEEIINALVDVCKRARKEGYEVLRAVNKEIRKKPLIIFTRIDAKVHYSIQDSDTGIIREFLAEGRENDVN